MSLQSSPRSLPLMRCLHQLRNGRCVISCSNFLVRGCQRSCFRICLPVSKLFLFLCSSDFSCSPSSTSSHTSFLASFSVLVLQRSRISSTFCFTLAAWELAFCHSCSARRTSHVLWLSNPLVRPTAQQTRLASCSSESSGQCSCSRCTIPPVRTRR